MVACWDETAVECCSLLNFLAAYAFAKVRSTEMRDQKTRKIVLASAKLRNMNTEMREINGIGEVQRRDGDVE